MRNLLWFLTLVVATSSVQAQAPLRLTRRFDLDWHHQHVMGVRFTPDGKTLISQGDSVRFWDVATGRATGLLDFAGIERPVLHVGPDGQSLGLSGWVLVDKKFDPQALVWKLPAPTRKAHQNMLLGYSPDNQPLFADFPSGKEITLHIQGKETKLVGHEAKAYAFALHPGGKILASASADKTIKLWDLATQKPIATFPETPPGLLRLGFSRDGKKLYRFVERTAKLWRLEKDEWQPDGKDLTLGENDFPRALSPDGTFMISAEASPKGSFVTRWDLPAGTQRWSCDGKVELCADVSPDGKIVATGNQYGAIMLLDADTGKTLRTIGSSIPFGTSGVIFDGGKSLLLTAQEIHAPGDRYWLRVVDLAAGKSTLIPLKAPPGRVAGSSDGKTLAVSHFDGSLHLLERDGKVRASIANAHRVGKGGEVSHLSFSPDNKVLASSGVNEFCLWDTATGAKLATLRLAAPFKAFGKPGALVFSHDGKTIAISSRDSLHLWDVADRKIKLDLKNRNGVFALAFSRDDKQIATGNTVGEIEIRAVDSGALVQQWKGHPKGISGLVFTPDNKALFSCGNDPDVRQWDAATGKAIAAYPTHYSQCLSVSFSPDGRTLLTTGLRGAIVWNVEKSK